MECKRQRHVLETSTRPSVDSSRWLHLENLCAFTCKFLVKCQTRYGLQRREGARMSPIACAVRDVLGNQVNAEFRLDFGLTWSVPAIIARVNGSCVMEHPCSFYCSANPRFYPRQTFPFAFGNLFGSIVLYVIGKSRNTILLNSARFLP